jgi:hypothetical protein
MTRHEKKHTHHPGVSRPGLPGPFYPRLFHDVLYQAAKALELQGFGGSVQAKLLAKKTAES